MVDETRARPWRRAGYTEDYILRLEATSLAIEAAVDCPFCGVLKGKRCLTNSGNFAWSPHETRRTAWHTQRVSDMAATQEFLLRIHDLVENSYRYPTYHEFIETLKELVHRELLSARDNERPDAGEGDSRPPDAGYQN